MTSKPVPIEKEYENIVPFRPLGMIEEMERLFENMMPRGWMRPFGWERHAFGEHLPQVDVIDKDDTIVVRAAVPGIKKEDLEVSTTDQTVTIRGQSRQETKEEEGEYYRHEIVSGNFLRTITLPAPVDESKVKAVFREGLLELTLPKRESAKRHTIEIEEG